VLALKTTEITLLTQNLRFAPILLLDDVSSELDPIRNERLFHFLRGFDGQVFITTTDASFIRIEHPAKHWCVENGAVREA
jgi:DNA replication and repair protein RecF